MTSWPLSLAAAVVLVLMVRDIGRCDTSGAAAYGFGFVLSVMLMPVWHWAYDRVAGWLARPKADGS